MSSIPKKTILLVDDDPAILSYLQCSLASYMCLDPTIAANGEEAVEKLNLGQIDLVVTDIQMPQMDGFALISHISQNFPKIPVVIITGHGSPTVEHKLNHMGILSHIKKPINIDELANMIFDLLVGVENGYIQGFSIASFLQLLQADRKSCTLKVTDGFKSAYVHLHEGCIWDAELDGLKGEEAVYELIGWEGPLTIDIQDILRIKERTIQTDLTFLIMESLRRKDENGTPASDRSSGLESAFALPELGSIIPAPMLEKQPERCLNFGFPIPEPVSSTVKEALADSLRRLVDVRGYKASAVITASGEALVTHSTNTRDDMQLVAKTVNNMFCYIQERGALIGMSQCEETVFRAPEGIVLLQCATREEKPHFHLLAITVDPIGEGLLRVRLKRVIDEVRDILLSK